MIATYSNNDLTLFKMKKLFTIAILMANTWVISAQNEVLLNINHKSGTTPLAYHNLYSNNQGDQFSFTRLDYYISNITLTHDGGQVTTLDDLFFLIHADRPFLESIGTLNINNLESVSFGIGVQEAYNHEDPSTYPSQHPLAFQNPSMHWGWSAGYRFAALEGMTSGNDVWQLHALGDKNYDYVQVTTSGKMVNGDLVIILDADYTQIFKDIRVNANLNYHGEDQQAPIALGNFHDHVYTEGQTVIGISENTPTTIHCFPNPVSGILHITGLTDGFNDINISNMLGEIVFQAGTSNKEMKLDLSDLPSGVYQLSMITHGTKRYAQQTILIH